MQKYSLYSLYSKNIYYIAWVMIKNSKYVKNNSVNPSYLMFNEINGYFEEINENKYLNYNNSQNI